MDIVTTRLKRPKRDDSVKISKFSPNIQTIPLVSLVCIHFTQIVYLKDSNIARIRQFTTQKQANLFDPLPS